MRTWPATAILVGLGAQALGADAPWTPSRSAQIEQGRAIFNSGPKDRAGIGPLYNATSCNACHSGGNRGKGPLRDGAAPESLVIQLETPKNGASGESTGDPVYGRVFNTSAVDGTRVEGTVTIRYSEIAGYYYPFGGHWSLRVPHYTLATLSRGPVASHTVIKPRIAPALFGVGMLAAVPDSAITQDEGATPISPAAGTVSWVTRDGTRVPGRMGWQCGAVTIRDQTTRAFAREMGLTSGDRPSDDCTAAEADCRGPTGASTSEVSEDLLDAVVAYVDTLAVPASTAQAQRQGDGFALFESTGCAACHRPSLPVQATSDVRPAGTGTIAAYTDLRLHDLGLEMADEDASGARIPTRWRTAPLWGLSHRQEDENTATFLHDGRARTAEEAILWHGGEASYAKRKFAGLGPRARKTLLQWLATL